MKPRTRARSLALQVLYEVDIAHHLPGDVFKSRLEDSTLSEELTEFARQIIFGVLPLNNNLDQLISKYAPEWPFDQIAAIDRNILRIALWEFAVSHETPIKVAINEAVELAKKIHEFFYGIHSIGWDIALTENGPVFLEGNNGWEISIMLATDPDIKKRYLSTLTP